jgi:hypothetical protein
MTAVQEDPMAGMTEATRPTIKFGKPGDWVRATVVDNTRQVENTLSAKHEMQTVYEFKIQGGQFHNIVDKVAAADPTPLEKGSFWAYFAKGVVHSQLKNAKIGQIIGLKFIEEKPSTRPGFNPTKVIKVFLGEVDPEYQGESATDF